MKSPSAYGLLEYGSGPLLQLAMLPLLVRALGPEEYSLVFAVQAFAGLGVLISVGWSIAGARATAASAADPTGWAVAFSLLLGLLCSLSVLLFGCAVLRLPPLSQLQLQPLHLAVACLILIFQQFDLLANGGIKGLSRYRDAALLEAAAKICTSIVSAFVAIRFAAGDAVIATQLIVTAMFSVLRMRVLARSYGRRIILPHWDGSAIVGMLGYSGWAWIAGVAAAVYWSVDRVLIAGTSEPETVVVYALMAQIANSIHMIVAALFQFMATEAAAHGQGVRLIGSSKRRQWASWNLLISLSIGLALTFLAPIFISFVGGWELSADQEAVVRLLSIAVGLMTLNIAAYYWLMGSGAPEVVAIFSVLAGVAMAGLIWGLGVSSVSVAYGKIVFAAVSGSLIIFLLCGVKR